MQNFIQRLEAHAVTQPDAVAITCGSESVTYQQVVQMLSSTGYHAQQYGLDVGDSIIFACKPTIRSVLFAISMMRIGVTVSIVDPFTSDDLFLNRSRSAKATHTIGNPILYRLGKFRKLFYRFTGKQLADLSAVAENNLVFGGRMKGMVDADTWSDDKNVTSEANYITGQPAIIVFTSGTTSEPKGVIHTLDSLSANVDGFADQMGIVERTRIYSEPMTLGLVALARGAEWIIPDKEKQFPDAEVWFGTPVDILKGLDLIKNTPTNSSVRTIGIGAAPVTKSLVEEIEFILGAGPEILCVYGMTELLPIAIGDARQKVNYLDRGDFVGFPVSTTTVEARDGELWVSGDASMIGYAGKEPVKAISTGDFGEVLPTGEIILQGRKKDMFIRGDMNIYPGLYEPGLATIKGVNQVAMVGIPDKYEDDEVVLAVTVQEGFTPAQVKQTVLKNMSRFVDSDAKPSDVFILPSFPVSGRANKLDRQQLKVDLLKLRDSK
jgi:acyl-CoA synthetase (AMP-forming)/AMP-acid ligase II